MCHGSHTTTSMNKYSMFCKKLSQDIPKPQFFCYTKIAVSKDFTIPEMEISISNTCNLRCKECGFLIPHQPKPTLSENIIQEHIKCLEILLKTGVKINSLAILGGEPTLNPSLLEKAVRTLSDLDGIEQLEVVTNGLNPSGFTKRTLEKIQKISVSVYVDDNEFISLWEKFIDRNAPHIKLAFRIQKPWDINTGTKIISDEEAQKFFENCWYKKHCVTIERSRLFLCSIAPKHLSDDDGLLLDENTSAEEIYKYLNGNKPLEYCKRCVPQMKLGKVPAGKQSDGVNLLKLIERAKCFLNLTD